MEKTKFILILTLALTALHCGTQKKSKAVYESKDLIINQISPNAFKHISFKQTNDFGNVPCNGLVVRNGQEVIIFDTPTNDKSSEELIRWVKETLHCSINAVVPTHFHDDCLGGLKAFETQGIPSYGHVATIELAKKDNLVAPKTGFRDSLSLKVGSENVVVKFLGEGHTKDNVVGYFPSEKVLFGGCLIKEVGASKGFTGDANMADWSNTVEKVKKAFPEAKIVIPGHGDHGDQKLLDYTIKLFKQQ